MTPLEEFEKEIAERLERAWLRGVILGLVLGALEAWLLLTGPL